MLILSNMWRSKGNKTIKIDQLTILTGKKNCALLNSVQKFIEIKGWLVCTFFIYLHNQLSSFNSIIVQMSEKRDLSNRQ